MYVRNILLVLLSTPLRQSNVECPFHMRNIYKRIVDMDPIALNQTQRRSEVAKDWAGARRDRDSRHTAPFT